MFWHPFQRRYLVEQSPVGAGAVEEQKALAAEPVVDGDADHAVAGEAVPGVLGDRPRTVHERATVDPHHDRQPGPPGIRGPDVQIQAVLTGDHWLGKKLVIRLGIGSGTVAPYAKASRTPSHRCGLLAGAARSPRTAAPHKGFP